MGRGLIVVVACALALAGCQTDGGQGSTQAAPPPPPKRNLKPAEAVAEARVAVVRDLKDPESARFTEVNYRPDQPNVKGEPTAVVCGMVNAKNSYGGYVGNRPFAYLVDTRLVTVADGTGGAGDLGTVVYKNLCGPQGR